jgi:hypothetical protein
VLILTRKVGETLMIGEKVTITVMDGCATARMPHPRLPRSMRRAVNRTRLSSGWTERMRRRTHFCIQLNIGRSSTSCMRIQDTRRSCAR